MKPKNSKILAVDKQVRPTDVAIINGLESIEDKIDGIKVPDPIVTEKVVVVEKETDNTSKLEEILEEVKKKEEVTDIQVSDEVLAKIKGEPGKDYILTDEDKKEIAKKVKVPVVEKTEVVREIPIVKEVAVTDTAKEIAEKINTLEKQIDFKVLKNVPEFSGKGGTKLISARSGGGVSKIVAGTNIAVSPADGKGDVTVSVTGDLGAQTFTDLTDTPSSYSGQGGKIVKVNGTEDGLEFDVATDTDEKVKYDAADPTAGYVADKFVAGSGISVAEGTGANENKLVITNTDKGSDVDLSGKEDVGVAAGLMSTHESTYDHDLIATALQSETDPIFSASEAANFVTGDKSKLDGIEAGAEVNVNADWNAVTGDAVILNKPTIPTQYTDEMAQDAVGNAVGNGLDYNDTTGAISVDETELDHNTLGGKQGGTTNEYYHLTAAQHGQLHAPVTVTDSSEIDFTLTGQDLTASLKAGSIDETKLDTSTNASLDLADSSVQPGDNVSDLTNDARYLTSESDTLDDVTGRGSTTSNSIGVGGVTVNSAYSLPTVDGSANQLIKTDGAGNLSWYTPSTVTDTFATIEVDGVAVSTNAPTLDFDSTYFTLTESPTDDFDITLNTTSLDSLYLKLDTSNDPLTGNLEILKTDPELRLTYDDANDYYTRLYRTASNVSYLKSQVNVPARASNALRFDGSSDKTMTVADNNMLAYGTNVFTATAWVKTSDTSSTIRTIMQAYTAGGGLFLWYRGSDDTFYAGWSGSGGQFLQDTFSINDGNWHHIVFVRTSASTLELWVDGVQRLTKSGITSTTMVQNADFEIGATASAAGREWNGDIDEVVIWARQLTSGEIGDLYNSGSGVYVDIAEIFPSSSTSYGTSITALYHLDEGSGTVAADSSGNGYNGTLVNSPTWINPGVLATTAAINDVTVLTIEDGVSGGAKGKITLGNNTSDTKIDGGETIINGASGISFDIANNTKWNIDGDGDLVTTSNSLHITGGKIGVGTNAPATYIQAEGTDGLLLTGTAKANLTVLDSTAGNRGISLGYDTSGQTGVIAARGVGGRIGFWTYDSSWAERVSIERDGDIRLKFDNQNLYFGAGDDASITYNGTNLVINPKEVGSGILDVSGTLQTDGYNSQDGSAGITQSIVILDGDGVTTHTMTFKNGLLTAYTAV